MGVLGYYLTVFPDVQAKLQDEIDELFESKDDGEEITSEDVTNMTYLDQVHNYLWDALIVFPSM